MSALENLEAEAALLGSMMALGGSVIDDVADRLSAFDFSAPVHARIYEACLNQHSQGKSPNPITLRGLFENDPDMKELGGPVYLMRLTSDPSGMVMLHRQMADEIANLAKRRRMKAGLQDAMIDCDDVSLSYSEIVSRADAALSEDASESIAQPTGAECLGALIDGLGHKAPGVTGAIVALDSLMGPIRPKQLAIMAGRPGMGKTAAALSYAIGAAQQGHGVLFVSLEMSAAELAERMAADLCFDGTEGVPYAAIRDGELNNWQRRRVAEAYTKMQGVPFQVVDAGSLTMGRLNMLVRRHARRMAAQGHKLELVVIDYLQLLHPDGKSRSQYEDVTVVSKGMKALAKDQDVGVLALAQLSRSVESREDKRPMLSDLRDSGQIEQDADAVLFLLRPEYYLAQSEPEQTDPNYPAWVADMESVRGAIEFIVAKRRNGTTGSATGKFFGKFQAVRG